MAKMFYTAKEAARQLGKTEEDLKDLVRKGTLREFRDAGHVNYKVNDVDALAGPGGSASGEIVLEPAEDSGIELAPSGSDVLSIEEVVSSDAAGDTQAAQKKKKEGTVVPSVGVNVFDDDELDEVVDPLAQTAVTDATGLDGAGSGSGILDLTRESDDTSLGAELLEEIYTGEDEGTVEMGEDTRAGLDEAIPETDARDEEEVFGSGAEPAATELRAPASRVVVTYAPDAAATGLTALMVVAVAVMWFAGLAGAGLVRGIVPSILKAVYQNLGYYSGGAFGVAAIAAVIAYFVAKRSS